MTSDPKHWEERLLQKAKTDGIENTFPRVTVPAEVLKRAYTHCAILTRQHSKTFYLASGLLYANQRNAARALYAFCRVSDDIVDRPPAGASHTATREDLARWKHRSLSLHPPEDDPVILAWAHTRAEYRIPPHYAIHLLEGMAQDLTVSRYRTFDELVDYCYAVASTVGLMTMHITGFSDEDALPYAIRLGIALQLTNILRDVAADWQKGRLYLPLEELAAFDLAEEDIAAGRNDQRWQRFMRFQIERTRRFYNESLPGIALLNGTGRFAIGAAAELYEAILTDIEHHQYDVFTRRAYTSRWEKLRRLPGIWWRSKIAQYSNLAGT